MFFHTKCWTLWAVICAIGSASIHSVKYSMVTMRYLIWRMVKGKGPKMSIPTYGKAMGYKSIATPRLVLGTNWRVFDIVRIAGHISRNLPSSSANITLLGWFSTREVVHRCGCHKHPREAWTLSRYIGLHLSRYIGPYPLNMDL